jgi:hypothetical protein
MALLKRNDDARINDDARVNNVLNRLAADDPALDFATTRWAFELRLILEKNHGNQGATALFAVVRVIFLVPLPLLAGLGASIGTKASWIRWTTFGLSLGAALIAAFVTGRGYEPRWRLYHRYGESLLEEGWLYAERAGAYAPLSDASPTADNLKNLFVTRTQKILSDMTDQYDAIVHAASLANEVAGPAAKH